MIERSGNPKNIPVDPHTYETLRALADVVQATCKTLDLTDFVLSVNLPRIGACFTHGEMSRTAALTLICSLSQRATHAS